MIEVTKEDIESSSSNELSDDYFANKAIARKMKNKIIRCNYLVIKVEHRFNPFVKCKIIATPDTLRIAITKFRRGQKLVPFKFQLTI